MFIYSPPTAQKNWRNTSFLVSIFRPVADESERVKYLAISPFFMRRVLSEYESSCYSASSYPLQLEAIFVSLLSHPVPVPLSIYTNCFLRSILPSIRPVRVKFYNHSSIIMCHNNFSYSGKKIMAVLSPFKILHSNHIIYLNTLSIFVNKKESSFTGLPSAATLRFL